MARIIALLGMNILLIQPLRLQMGSCTCSCLSSECILSSGFLTETIKRTLVMHDKCWAHVAMDAAIWKRLCSSFQTSSSDLCSALSSLARKIGTSYVDPSEPISSPNSKSFDGSLTKCRVLLAPNWSRRGGSSYHCKAILRVERRQDVLSVQGSISYVQVNQVDVKLLSYAIRHLFGTSDCEAVLLADAQNAFRIHSIEVLLY